MPEKNREVREKIQSIPDLELILRKKTTREVTHIDNSRLKFFPPIFDQVGNSCSQASGIRYHFTYEINRIRDRAANTDEHIYAYHYTWNFLNKGTDLGTWYYDGFDLVKDNGVPTMDEFNDEAYYMSLTRWMDGYPKYYQAIHNRIKEYYKLDASEEGALEQMKQYLIDHGEETEYGGLINFSGKTTNWDMFEYNGPAHTNYQYAIRNFGNGGDHAMTIAGFDDKIEIDVNQNGYIEEGEKGAFIIVNSWGSGWGSNGRAYMPYKLLKKSYNYGGIGNSDKYVYMLEAKDHTPKVVGKAIINYTSRNDLYFILGVAGDATATSPERIKFLEIMKNQGGDHYMKGTTNSDGKSLEVGLDYTSLIEKVPEAKKYFLTVKQTYNGEVGSGKIENLTILDYREDPEDPKVIKSSSDATTIEGKAVATASNEETSETDIVKIQQSSFKIFPNPLSETMYIRFSEQRGRQLPVHITIYDLTGKKVITHNFKTTHSKAVSVDLERLQSGIYLCEVSLEKGGVTTKKLIVK